jgi:hypothetical protein
MGEASKLTPILAARNALSRSSPGRLAVGRLGAAHFGGAWMHCISRAPFPLTNPRPLPNVQLRGRYRTEKRKLDWIGSLAGELRSQPLARRQAQSST